MRRDRLLKKLFRERFVITLKSGETFDGLLDEVDDRMVSFVDANAVTERSRLSIDGSLYLPRDQIAYLQRTERS